MSFKIGDKVKCKPGFNTCENSGGAGYREGKEFTIHSITIAYNNVDLILWPSTNSNGIYDRACELVPTNPWDDSKLVFKFIT